MLSQSLPYLNRLAFLLSHPFAVLAPSAMDNRVAYLESIPIKPVPNDNLLNRPCYTLYFFSPKELRDVHSAGLVSEPVLF
jgi:hypothetical protein